MASVINPQLLKIARQSVTAAVKRSFVDAAAATGGDPAAAAAGGGMPMDPAAAGGMPMDPAAGGAPPPMPADPMAGGAAGPDIQTMITQAVQQAMSQQGGGAAGGAGIKPKIDVNVEIMQMKKLLARIADGLNIPIPAAEMTATPQDLTQMAAQSEAAGAAGGAAPPPSAVKPIEPLQGAAPAPGGEGTKTSQVHHAGDAVPSLVNMRDQAAAMRAILQRRS